MLQSQIIRVNSKEDLQLQLISHAAKGFVKLHEDANITVMSRKKPFNWVLAIVCLFIPIIGWIAPIMMIMAANRGHEMVELHVTRS